MASRMQYQQQQQQRGGRRMGSNGSSQPNNNADSASVVSNSYSQFSVASTYRHDPSSQFHPSSSSSSGAAAAGAVAQLQLQQKQQQQQPQPVLTSDSSHKPKTRGSLGILVVGVGGANGTTLLAGLLANRLGINWRGPKGEPMSPNYNGCITQLDERGVHGGVGYRNLVKGLADASMAAIGGWDIRPAKLGDALLDAQVLDYDLVRQVQDEMNRVKVFRGLYDPRFIGSSQHETATYVLTEQEAQNDSEALKCLRADIRYFKWRNGVVGHTTVIYSASVEPNSDLVSQLETAQDVLDVIEMSEQERGGALPPSFLYAAAALLEGCSFVNGGSQNTLSCPGLNDLAQQQLGVYCLGTDFKAGQTKFKTAAVEYLRTIGLTPRVIASSNHLGNNDMRNLASAKSASTAKLRVKQDIFESWEEKELDHKVSIMYTPFINDDKRDFVECTSLGFLGQTHTMVTYTRASDSVLCVPLMIDVAVWCDFFSSRSWPYEKVARALAYLFKVPEGAATGVDPGFFAQMNELRSQALAAHESKTGKKQRGSVTTGTDVVKQRRVRIRAEEKAAAEWAIPHDARIVCAGLACVDMQLNNSTGGDGGEGIETFAGEKSVGGGSVSMACKTLARLCHGAPLDDGYMQISPPVVHSVIPLCKIGNDDTGNKLLTLLENCGQACRNVDTRIVKTSRTQDPDARTALAILPIYSDGRRGCFFDAASNDSFSAKQMVEFISNLSSGSTGPALNTTHMSYDDMESYRERIESMTPTYGAFLFGYPHLLPLIQGEALAQVLLEARRTMLEGGIVALDLNGVNEASFARSESYRHPQDLRDDPVIGQALEHIDILHMNEDELVMLTGCQLKGTPRSERSDEFAIGNAVNIFLACGVAVVAVTRGKRGSYVACNRVDRFRRSPMLPAAWAERIVSIPAAELPPGTVINSNGAGDSFTSGLLVAAMLRHTGMTVPTESSSPQQRVNKSLDGINGSPVKTTSMAPKKKKTLTPYNLYMRENYVSLKQQCKDDKKKIFTRCHQMWENESPDVKALYERKAAEENERGDHETDDSEANRSLVSSSGGGSSINHTNSNDGSSSSPAGKQRNLYMTNQSLNLDSAVQFATLVAAHHIDMNTRELLHIDVNQLLQRSIIYPNIGRQEI